MLSNNNLTYVPSTGNFTSVSFTTSSDRRIKSNITNISSTVDDLHPVKYFNSLSNSYQYGFIADELQEIFPEMVNGKRDGPNYQSINYIQLIAVLVKEIQELKKLVKN